VSVPSSTSTIASSNGVVGGVCSNVNGFSPSSSSSAGVSSARPGTAAPPPPVVVPEAPAPSTSSSSSAGTTGDAMNAKRMRLEGV
jgi:hypothetical protein